MLEVLVVGYQVGWVNVVVLSLIAFTIDSRDNDNHNV